ncbi:MAG: diguanylate cyclase [Gemmatimonadales bacterium]
MSKISMSADIPPLLAAPGTALNLMRYTMIRALASTLALFQRARRVFRTGWRKFWRAPDPLVLDEGSRGELAIAKVRLAIILVLFLLPVIQLIQEPEASAARVALAAAAIALALTWPGFVAAKRRDFRRFLGFATGVLDVSLVSGVLLLFMLTGQPLIAVNSVGLFSIYLLAIAATSLRNDPRVCVLAGGLAIAQYAALAAYVDVHWDLTAPDLARSEYGVFDLNNNYTRLVIMACAVLVSTVAVLRTQRLRWLSAKDPLTGLLNRGFFDERAQAEVTRTLRYNRRLSLALIDIDHFKTFNDTYGHVVGDEVLRVLAEMLLKSVRRSDIVARYGGEELVILFPETPVDRATDKAEDLRTSIEASSVTVCIGMASMPDDGSDLRTLIDVADRRLYSAKESGRNRVVGPANLNRAAS